MSGVTPSKLGLTSAEAAARLLACGSNTLDGPRRRSLLRLVFETLREPMFLLLLAAVGLYFALGDLTEALLLAISASLTIALSALAQGQASPTSPSSRHLNFDR